MEYASSFGGLSDSIAILALGVLSRAGGASEREYTTTALWASFLLMHLGGPDNITAYAMADNELWLRHLLGLVSQASVVVYVFSRAFTWALLDYLSMLIFSAGVVKYGERIWVLFSSSKDRYRGSLVSRPDPGPNYAKFMDELVSRETEGYIVSLGNAVDNIYLPLIDPEANNDQRIRDAFLLQKAYAFFGTFKKLFADLILSFQDRKLSISFFEKMEWKDAFTILEIELGLIFDLFYTKSPLIFSTTGVFLRIFNCLSTVATLVAFPIIMNKDSTSYPKIEVVVTSSLLADFPIDKT